MSAISFAWDIPSNSAGEMSNYSGPQVFQFGLQPKGAGIYQTVLPLVAVVVVAAAGYAALKRGR